MVVLWWIQQKPTVRATEQLPAQCAPVSRVRPWPAKELPTIHSFKPIYCLLLVSAACSLWQVIIKDCKDTVPSSPQLAEVPHKRPLKAFGHGVACGRRCCSMERWRTFLLQPGELHVRQGHGVGSIVLALKLVVSNLMLLNCYYTKWFTLDFQMGRWSLGRQELLMKRDYQAQKMRVKKAELYRYLIGTSATVAVVWGADWISLHDSREDHWMLRRRCEGLGSAHSAEDGSLKGIKSLTCFDSTMFYPSFQLSVPQGLKWRGFGGAEYQEYHVESPKARPGSWEKRKWILCSNMTWSWSSWSIWSQGQLLGGQHITARILHDPLSGGSAEAGPALSPLKA